MAGPILIRLRVRNRATVHYLLNFGLFWQKEFCFLGLDLASPSTVFLKNTDRRQITVPRIQYIAFKGDNPVEAVAFLGFSLGSRVTFFGTKRYHRKYSKGSYHVRCSPSHLVSRSCCTFGVLTLFAVFFKRFFSIARGTLLRSAPPRASHRLIKLTWPG